MDFTCAVWIEDSLVHYHVSRNDQRTYVARLLGCIRAATVECKPPQKIVLHKKDQGWTGDHSNKTLVNELSRAIEENLWVEELCYGA